MTSWTDGYVQNIPCRRITAQIWHIGETKKERRFTIKSSEKKATRSRGKISSTRVCVATLYRISCCRRIHYMVAQGGWDKNSKWWSHKYEAKLSRFSGTAEEVFHLWSLRVQAALKSRALLPALWEENVHNTVHKQDRAIIIAAFGKNQPSAMQDCHATKLVSKRLQTRYASKSPINELSVLNNLRNTKVRISANMGDHISYPAAQYWRLVSMHWTVSKSMKIALVLSSISTLPE